MSKPKETPSDQCRVCRCNFKVKFGTAASQPSKTDYISSENLFKASKRKDTYGQILADICRAVGIEVVQHSLVSDRVCNPCARKIRNLGTLYKLIQSSMGAECKTQEQTTRPSKRLLDTPPGSSPCRKNVRVNSPASQKPSRKSLHFPTTTDEAQQIKDSIDSKLNVDDLLTDGSLEVKVVIVDGTGKPTARIPQDVESKQIVRQVCNKNWQEAANTILRHKELKPEVVKSLKKNVSEEVANYLKPESILLLSEPDEIASFNMKRELNE